MEVIMKAIRWFGFMAIYLSILGASCFPVQAQEDEAVRIVEAIGSGAIIGDDMASAREHAIFNALISAVAVVSIELLPVQSQVDNFKLFNEMFYDQTDSYIQDYKVLTEYISRNSYRAMVQATVMKEKIKEDLMHTHLIVEDRVMPKVLFFIAEQQLIDILPIYWWGEDLVFVVPPSEDAMAQILRDSDFTVVSHNNIVDPVNYSLDISIQDAIDLGKNLVADIVIIGKSKAEKTTNVMEGSVKSFKGSVTVRAFRTETGEEIAFASRTAVFASEDDEEGGRNALSNAGMLVGQDLAVQLSSAWANLSERQATVKIEIHGTSELANFVKFRQVLGKIPGVKAIHIEEMKADASLITVDFDGTSQSLADALLLRTFDSFGIDIYEVSPGKLSIELIGG